MVEVMVDRPELKARLDEYLAQVREGDTVVVTDGGRAVARVTPAHAAQSLDERLRELQAAGVVQWGGGKLEPFDSPARLTPGDKTIAEIVEELRD